MKPGYEDTVHVLGKTLEIMMKALVNLFMVAAIIMSAHVYAETRDPGEYFFNQTFGDFQEELELARDEGKKAILVMFVMDECPYCHRMKTTVLNQKEVQDYYRENFLIFEVDIEGDIEMTDFNGEVITQKNFSEKKHRVRATPVFAFFDLKGERVTRYIGATTGVDEFLHLGKFVASGAYQEMSFTRYKREHKPR